MVVARRRSLLAGTCLLAASATSLVLSSTRLASAMLGPAMGALVFAVAALGLAMGAAVHALRPELARPPALLGRLASIAALGVPATLASFVVTLRAEPIESIDRAGLRSLAGLLVANLAPFVVVGLGVGGATAHARGSAGRASAAAALGAALGVVTWPFVLRAGAPRAGLLAGIGFGLASVAFAWGTRSRDEDGHEEPPTNAGWNAAAGLLCAIALLLGDVGERWLETTTMQYVRIDRAQLARWTELGFVTLDKPTRGTAWVRVDAGGATTALEAKAVAPKQPAELAHALGVEGPVLALFASTGRDVRAALSAGRRAIVAVEPNETVARDVMQRELGAFTSDLFARPEVRLEVADPRAFVRASEAKWAAIVVGHAEPSAAPLAPGLPPAQTLLTTREGMVDLLDDLTARGLLVLSRPEDELPGLALTAARALRDVIPSSQPFEHLFACAHQRSSALVVARTPLLAESRAALGTFCKRHGFRSVGWINSDSSSPRPPSAAVVTDDRALPVATWLEPEAVADGRDRGRGVRRSLGALSLSLVVAAVVAAASALHTSLSEARRGAAQTVGAASFGLARGLLGVGLATPLVVLAGRPLALLTSVGTAWLFGLAAGALHVRSTPVVHAGARLATRGLVLAIAAVALAVAAPELVVLAKGRVALGVATASIVAFALGAIDGGTTTLASMVQGSWARSLVGFGRAAHAGGLALALTLGPLLAARAGSSYVVLVAACAAFVGALTVGVARASAPR